MPSLKKQTNRMRTTKILATTSVASICAAVSALSTTYTDSTGDGAALLGNPHLDISSVVVKNTATEISFTINLVGDPIAVNWGQYQIGIDSIAGGATSGTVPPSRPISMSSGMDYYIRSWDGGAELYHWNAGGPWWALDSATWSPPSSIQFPAKTTSSVTLTTTLASLGLAYGDSFSFDVWTSGATGTDSAIDALANPVPTAASSDWTSAYDSGANVFQYTVTAVPEPGTFALGAAGLAMFYVCRRCAK
jgi:hypothetical protein